MADDPMCAAASADGAPLLALLRPVPGVKPIVERASPGGTAGLRQIDLRQKALRLINKRGL